MSKHLLGKIFISHSSVDKPFVRRLAARIRKAGYEVWLDEHELLAGDALGEKIAVALKETKVIIVVVSENSVKSKWLKYELNIATERMVKDDRRVIPAVIDDAPLPPEVTGRIYADFRKSFSTGLKSILSALDEETRQATSRAGFWIEARNLLEGVFGGRGYGSIRRARQDIHYDLVYLPATVDGNNDTEVVYEIVSSYSTPAQTLTDAWWEEYEEAIAIYDENLFLVVTERPVDFNSYPGKKVSEKVGYWGLRFDPDRPPYAYVVVADLSGIATGDERKRILLEAKVLLARLATSKAQWAE
jgi:hypothetical protein